MLLLLLLLPLMRDAASAPSVIQQVHLLPAGSVSDIVVSWAVSTTVASGSVPPAVVLYRAVDEAVWRTANGSSETLSLAMNTPVILFDVLLTSLRPSILYLYAPGGVGDAVFNFTTQPATRCSSVAADGRTCTGYIPQRIAVIADMGLTNAVSVPRLIADAELGSISMLVHSGDYAYDAASAGGETGNAYMRMMEPIASRIPYAVCAGNHEYQPSADPFLHHRRRFSGLAWAVGRSNSTTTRYYSFNEGLVHWVAIDTEFHYYGGTADQIEAQYAWLRADLAAVNRSLTPWIVAFGHKQGWMDLQNFTLFQDILLQNRVNLYFTGHQHNYQRALPLRTRPGTSALVERSCVSGGNSSLYSNCNYMASIVVGSAGCREYLSTGGIGAYATGFQAVAYGYGYLTVWNHTHLQWRWVQVANNSGVQLAATDPPIVDEMWMVQLNNTPVVLPLPTAAVSAVPSPAPSVSTSPSDTSAAGAGGTAGPTASPTVVSGATQTQTCGPAQNSPASTASPAVSPAISAQPSAPASSTPLTTLPASAAASLAVAQPSHTSQLFHASVLLFLNSSASPRSLLKSGNHTCSLLHAVAELFAWSPTMLSLRAIATCSAARAGDVQYNLLSYLNATGCRMTADGSSTLLLPSPQPSAVTSARRLLEPADAPISMRYSHRRSRQESSERLSTGDRQRLLLHALGVAPTAGGTDGLFVAESPVDDALWQSAAATWSASQQSVTVLRLLVSANSSAADAAPAAFGTRLQSLISALESRGLATNASTAALHTFEAAVAAISGAPMAAEANRIIVGAQLSASFVAEPTDVAAAAGSSPAASVNGPSNEIPHVAVAVGTVLGCLAAVGLWVAVDFLRKRRHRQRVGMAVKRRLSMQAVDPKSATLDSLQWGEQMDNARRTSLQTATTRARSSVTALSNPMHSAVAGRAAAPPTPLP
jgi:hypothetical protein